MHTLAFLAGAMVWSQVSSFLAINVDFQRVENLNTNDCYRKTTLMVNITSCMYPHEEFLPQISASVYAMKTLILQSKTILLEIRELWRERCILVMMGICLLCLFVCWEDNSGAPPPSQNCDIGSSTGASMSTRLSTLSLWCGAWFCGKLAQLLALKWLAAMLATSRSWWLALMVGFVSWRLKPILLAFLPEFQYSNISKRKREIGSFWITLAGI